MTDFILVIKHHQPEPSWVTPELPGGAASVKVSAALTPVAVLKSKELPKTWSHFDAGPRVCEGPNRCISCVIYRCYVGPTKHPPDLPARAGLGPPSSILLPDLVCPKPSKWADGLLFCILFCIFAWDQNLTEPDRGHIVVLMQLDELLANVTAIQCWNQ